MAVNIEEILKTSVTNRSLIHIPDLDKYIGWLDLRDFSFVFKTIGINRIINEDVVTKRVKENEDCYTATGKYYDFGNAELMIIRENNDNIFYIIDGQHRISTMQRLKLQYPDRKLIIGISIYVKDTIDNAVSYLKHFQNQYPSDDRLFSANIIEREQLEKVLGIFRYLYPNTFKAYDKHILKLINKTDKYYKEPNKPHLSDGIISDFIRNPELKISKLNNPNITMDDIRSLNTKIKDNLHFVKSVNVGLIETLDGCYFGLIRKDCQKLLEALNTI
jgi:hypothetical protein